MNAIRWCVPFVLVAAMGCGRGAVVLPQAPVSGVVTYQGKPLGGGRIVFFHPSGQAAGSDIGANGAFKLVAFQGKNQVSVECFASGPNGTPGPRSLVPTRSLVPERYAEFHTSGLTFEVKAGENEAKFPLTD